MMNRRSTVAETGFMRQTDDREKSKQAVTFAERDCVRCKYTSRHPYICDTCQAARQETRGYWKK